MFLIVGIVIGLYLVNLTSALIIQSVSTYPDKISPGESSEITMNIKNDGDNDLTDVSVRLDFTGLPLAPYNSGSSFNTNEILSGKIKEADFNIIADNSAVAGLYKIPIIITYNENDVIKTVQSMISIRIDSEPVIEVSSDSGLLLRGKENVVSIKIVNKGLGDAKFLDVETMPGTYYTLLTSPKSYIGDVSSNDYQTIDYNIYFKDPMPGTIYLPVTVRYKDATNKDFSINSQLALKVYSQKEATQLGLVSQSSIGYIIGAIIFIVVIFFIYRIIRRRKKKAE